MLEENQRLTKLQRLTTTKGLRLTRHREQTSAMEVSTDPHAFGVKERVPHTALLRTMSGAAGSLRKVPGPSLPADVPPAEGSRPRGCQGLLPSGGRKSSENARVPSLIEGHHGDGEDLV